MGRELIGMPVQAVLQVDNQFALDVSLDRLVSVVCIVGTKINLYIFQRHAVDATGCDPGEKITVSLFAALVCPRVSEQVVCLWG